MAVDTYALTTLANAQDYLGDSDPENAALYERLIDAATVAMERYCGREFKERAHADWIDGSGARFLYLDNAPVTQLNRVCRDVLEVLEVWNTSNDAHGAAVRTTSTGIVCTVYGGANAGSDTLLYADYATVSTLETAIEALGKGWQADAYSTYGTLSTADIKATLAGQACLDNAIASNRMDLVLPWDMLEDVDVSDGMAGRIVSPSGFPRGRNNIFADYTGGYNSTSHNAELRDLEDICLRVVKLWADAKEHDGGLASESLGDYSYTQAESTALLAGLDAATRMRLDLYKVVRV